MAYRKIAEVVADPTLPSTSLEIDGITYSLCFDLRAMAEAQQYFKRQGHEVNLLQALPNIDLDSCLVIFPCIVHKYHPELSWDEAQKLITLATLYPIATKIGEAWQAGVPEKEAPEENPPEAVPDQASPAISTGSDSGASPATTSN
jgi:hypothetical protein